MKKIIPFLLIWNISMLFAEVFSWASQMRFIDLWAILIAFLLYLFHTTFLLWIAYSRFKIWFTWLYFLWVIFWLYESWVTKVLWAWYMDQAWPWMWTLLGLSMPEFPILVFLWHPIMSFILPIFVFQIITNNVLDIHTKYLIKSKIKTSIIVISLFFVSTFLLNWNQFNLLSANISLIWTIWIISLLSLFNNSNIDIFKFTKFNFWWQLIYILLLYIVTFIVFLPDRIPLNVLPYFSLILFYLFTFYVFKRIKVSDYKIVQINENIYRKKDLLVFSIILLIFVNILSFLKGFALWILVMWYVCLLVLWVILFFLLVIKVLFSKKKIWQQNM